MHAGQRRDDNVASFARAPSGCATTLDFDRSGVFTLYIETTGSIDDLTGDCAAPGEYDRDGIPVIDVSLVDAEGALVTIEASSGVDYDTGTFVGTSTGTVEITEPGDHVLTVAADGGAFAIAVGGDPDDGVRSPALVGGVHRDRCVRGRRGAARARKPSPGPAERGRRTLAARSRMADEPARVSGPATHDRRNRSCRSTAVAPGMGAAVAQ